METETIGHWKNQNPELYRAMAKRGALRALAHVLVQKTVEAERMYIRAGMYASDARMEAYREWMMMEPDPEPQPKPTTE